HPCKSRSAKSARFAGAVAGGRPSHPGALKPVPQHGSPPAVPSNPNSRLGRRASPVAQGGVKMEAIYVGVDVSKDRLGIAVRPSGEAFVVTRDGKGWNELIERLQVMGLLRDKKVMATRLKNNTVAEEPAVTRPWHTL